MVKEEPDDDDDEEDEEDGDQFEMDVESAGKQPSDDAAIAQRNLDEAMAVMFQLLGERFTRDRSCRRSFWSDLLSVFESHILPTHATAHTQFLLFRFLALDAEEEDNLFCVACDKEMRNEKAFATHRSSKKHLENVERLKEMLQDEDLMSSSDEVPSSDHEPEPPTPEAESDKQHSEAEETPSPNKSDKKSKASKKKQKNNNKDLQNSDNDEDRTAVKSVNDVPTGAKGNKKKRRKAKGSTKHCEDGSADAAAELIDPLSCQVCKTKFQSKNKLFSHLKESKHAVRI